MSETFLDEDHETIWLAPVCDGSSYEGRLWCCDNVFEDECECGGKHKPIKYVRAQVQE